MLITVNGKAYEFAEGTNALDMAAEIDKELKRRLWQPA